MALPISAGIGMGGARLRAGRGQIALPQRHGGQHLPGEGVLRICRQQVPRKGLSRRQIAPADRLHRRFAGV